MERRGEAALHTVSSGACHSTCQQLGGRSSRPWPMASLCERQGAICTTTALFFSVCALLRTAEPALSQGLVGLLGRHRLDHKALPLPQSHP